jgi:hypothetical protein
MPIEVVIQVVAIDTDRGVKSTREDVVVVPGKVMKLHEILGGDEDEILRRMGDSVFSAALRELQAGKADVGKAMMEMGGGRIGGRSPAPAPAAPVPGAPPMAASPAPASGGDRLSEMLGLDIIQNQTQRDRAAAQQPAPGPAPAPPQSGPGPVGFPRG